MKLTSFSDYTLRVLMYLAVNTDRLATIQGIATSYGISESHLTKVVHHLAKTGVVESIRGKGGGIRLALQADQIRLGRIVRESEGGSPIVECFAADNQCRISASCKLAGILKQSFDGFFQSLDQYTLADLIESPRAVNDLMRLVAIAPET
ncbi:Rrf2 family transcriptional regulator [Chitinimonas sp.]|uniref:RrF2 family transcriptional regulator n=1 Tax=Chitinimonas sp. TaxID=1934313 RepID=UPI0035AEE878